MQADSKKRKIESKSSLSTPFAPSDCKDTDKTSRDNWKVPLVQNSSMSARIQQSKNFAVAQAQQEGCTGNYRIFDSPFEYIEEDLSYEIIISDGYPFSSSNSLLEHLKNPV